MYFLSSSLNHQPIGIEITRPMIAETTALGAAYAAGLAVKFWNDTKELKEQWQQSRRWHPSSTSELATTGFTTWKKAIERTLNWID